MKYQTIKENIKIIFEYFDKNDGFIIQIIYTGDTEKSLSVRGTVKRVGPLLKRKINFEPFYVRIIEKITKKKKYLNISLKIAGWVIVLLSVLLLMLIIYAAINGTIKKEEFISFLLAFVIYLFMGIDVIRPKIPREFKDFYEIIEKDYFLTITNFLNHGNCVYHDNISLLESFYQQLFPQFLSMKFLMKKNESVVL